jgi:hypothetical protein
MSLPLQRCAACLTSADGMQSQFPCSGSCLSVRRVLCRLSHCAALLRAMCCASMCQAISSGIPRTVRRQPRSEAFAGCHQLSMLSGVVVCRRRAWAGGRWYTRACWTASARSCATRVCAQLRHGKQCRLGNVCWPAPHAHCAAACAPLFASENTRAACGRIIAYLGCFPYWHPSSCKAMALNP